MMVVVVMLGLLAGMAVPYLGRDGTAMQSHGFARTVARDLQRARMEAVAERLSMYLFVFQDRIELRSAVPGLRPGETPQAPTLADPVMRVLLAGDGVVVMDVRGAPSPPTEPALTTSTHRTIEVNARGQAQLVGHPALTPAFMYLRNTRVPASHPERDVRVDVVPLTAAVAVRDRWQ